MHIIVLVIVMRFITLVIAVRFVALDTVVRLIVFINAARFIALYCCKQLLLLLLFNIKRLRAYWVTLVYFN